MNRLLVLALLALTIFSIPSFAQGLNGVAHTVGGVVGQNNDPVFGGEDLDFRFTHSNPYQPHVDHERILSAKAWVEHTYVLNGVVITDVFQLSVGIISWNNPPDPGGFSLFCQTPYEVVRLGDTGEPETIVFRTEIKWTYGHYENFNQWVEKQAGTYSHSTTYILS